MTIARRGFAGLLGVAFLAPFAPALKGLAQAPAAVPPDEALTKALAFLDRHVTALRAHPLPYDQEPAFVFQVRIPSGRRQRP